MKRIFTNGEQRRYLVYEKEMVFISMNAYIDNENATTTLNATTLPTFLSAY